MGQWVEGSWKAGQWEGESQWVGQWAAESLWAGEEILAAAAQLCTHLTRGLVESSTGSCAGTGLHCGTQSGFVRQWDLLEIPGLSQEICDGWKVWHRKITIARVSGEQSNKDF